MKNHLPPISVIIPAYNEEKYIEQTLKAVKAQTYPNIELIVVDNNSTDNTRKIAEKYADKVVIEKKQGVSFARNRGAKEAKGEILVFVDADTELEKNCIQEIAKIFENPKVVCATVFIKTRGKFLYRMYCYVWSSVIWFLSLLGIPQFPGICVGIKKTIFFKVKGFREDLESSEDINICERISKLGKCVFIRSGVAYSSPRKLEKMGFLNAVCFWIINYFLYN